MGTDQTNAAYVFEHCSRATLRQHLSEEPFRTEGWELGISETWQYRRTAPISRAKRTLTVLRIIKYVAVDLVGRHAANADVSEEEKSLVFLCRSPKCKQQLLVESQAGGILASSSDVARLEESLLASCLKCYDQMLWDDDDHRAVRGRVKESSYSAQAQLHFPDCADSDLQWFDDWFWFLDAERDTPKCRELPGYDALRDIAADEVAAGDAGDFDFDPWTSVVLPTMNVHVLGVDRRDGHQSYEISEYAMYYVNVCVPFSSCLSDELMARLAALVHYEYLETDRGRELFQLGSLKRDIGHHKKKENEYGTYCFVVGACASDRLAATLFFYPHPNTKFRKPIEMTHWYVASGFAKQHHLQEVMLARVRDIGLAQTLVRVVLKFLHVEHAGARYLCKDAAANSPLSALWCDTNNSVHIEPLPLVNSGLLAAAKSVGSGPAFADCMQFLSDLLSGFSSLRGLLSAVTSVSQSEAVDVRGDRPHEPVGALELKVLYTHESCNCQVPPAEVCLPGLFSFFVLGWFEVCS